MIKFDCVKRICRVVECRLAAVMLGKKLNLNWKDIR